MPSTNDYERRIRRAQRIGTINESNSHFDWNEEPEEDEVEEECYDNMPKLKRESVEVMETLAATDPLTFTYLLKSEGIDVLGHREYDPLVTEAVKADVMAVASVISESPNSINTSLDKWQVQVQQKAHEYGYIVCVR